MADELQDFNEKTKTQDSLYSELKKIDEQKRMPDDSAAEMDKRRQILKGLKKQIDTDDAFKPKPVKDQQDSSKPVDKPVASGGWMDDVTAFKVE